jgi:hypothetical protein
MQPPEVRILKHLLSEEDARQRRADLASAFEPGPELETEAQDFLCTCARACRAPLPCPADRVTCGMRLASAQYGLQTERRPVALSLEGHHGRPGL